MLVEWYIKDIEWLCSATHCIEDADPESVRRRASTIRVVKLSIMQAAVNMGFAFGNLFGGLAVQHLGPDASFGLIAALSAVALLCLCPVPDLRPDADAPPLALNTAAQDTREREPSREEQVSAAAAAEAPSARTPILVRGARTSARCSTRLCAPFRLMADSFEATFWTSRPQLGRWNRLLVVLPITGIWTYVLSEGVENSLNFLYFTLSPRSFSPDRFGVYSLVARLLMALSLSLVLPAVRHLARHRDHFYVNIAIGDYWLMISNLKLRNYYFLVL